MVTALHNDEPVAGSLGQHVAIRRYYLGVYTYDHHAIVSNAEGTRVIHFWSPTYLEHSTVRETTFKEYLLGQRTADVRLVPHETLYSADQVVARARSQIGRNDFSIIGDNCEAFANWCVTGRAVSNQVVTMAQQLVMRQTLWLNMAGRFLLQLSNSVQQRYTNTPFARLHGRWHTVLHGAFANRVSIATASDVRVYRCCQGH